MTVNAYCRSVIFLFLEYFEEAVDFLLSLPEVSSTKVQYDILKYSMQYCKRRPLSYVTFFIVHVPRLAFSASQRAATQSGPWLPFWVCRSSPILFQRQQHEIFKVKCILNKALEKIEDLMKTNKFTGSCWLLFFFMLRIRIRSRNRMFLGFPDLDPLVRGMDPDPRSKILLSSSKNSKKNLDSYCFVNSL